MMNIRYYCLENDENCLELEVFKSIHDEDFRNTYSLYGKEELSTHLYIKSESSIPFAQDELVAEALKREGDHALPIVICNNEIIKRGAYLSAEELSKLLDIGISTQSDE